MWQYNTFYDTSIQHHGILGQKWGIRRYQNADGTLTPEGKVTSTAIPIGVAVATPIVGYNVLVPYVAAKLSDPVVQQKMTNIGYAVLNSDPVQQFMQQTVNTAVPVATRAAARELLTNKEVQQCVVSSVKDVITTEGTKALNSLNTSDVITDLATRGAGGLATVQGMGYVRRATSAKNKLDKYSRVYST